MASMHCRVCEGELFIKKFSRKKITREFEICNKCGFVFCPENTYQFADTESFKKDNRAETTARVGDGKKPGREFGMASTAYEIGKRAFGKGYQPKLLLVGVGLSKDHEILRKSGLFSDVLITDLENHQDSAHFVKLGDDGREYFDMIVTSEVLEHLESPQIDLKRIHYHLNKEKGLAIHGTNINDGTPLDKVRYPWVNGHCSYWSGDAVREYAANNDLFFDIRCTSTDLVTYRKRYIFFYQNSIFGDHIPAWFGWNRYAYSELMKK